MATIAELLVKIGLDDSELKSGEKSINSSLGAIGGKIAQLGVSVKAFQAILSGIEFNKVKQQAEIAFTTMLGSAGKAKDIMGELRDLSVKTPLEFKDVRSAGQTLLQFGVSASKVTDTVKMLGDVALGDANKLQSLSVAFGQVQSAGKLTGQDLLQFINAGFNPLNEIAKKTGESMSELRDRMSAGGISAKEVSEAFQSATMAGGQFDNAMNKMSNSLQGAQSNFQDAFDTFKGQATDALTKPLTEAFNKLGKILQDMKPQAEALGRSLALVFNVIAKVGEGLAFIASKLDLTIVAGAALGLAFGPWGALIGAAVGAVASLVTQIQQAVKHAKEGTDSTVKWTFATKSYADMVDEATNSVKGLTDEELKHNKAIYEGLAARATGKYREYYEAQISAINAELKARQKLTKEEKDLIEDRAKFEKSWLEKSTKDEQDKLDMQYQDAMAEAKRLGADTTEIQKWYYESSYELFLKREKDKADAAEKEQEAIRAAYDKTYDELGDNINWLYQYSKDQSKKTAENIKTYITTALDQISSLGNKLIEYFNASAEAQMEAIDVQTQAKLEAEGLAEDTTLERLQKEYDAAIAAGDSELANEKRIEIERQKIIEEGERKKAQIKYQADLATWQGQIGLAIADAAKAIISIWAQWAANPIVAGILTAAAGAATGIEIATMNANKPKPPAFASGTMFAPGGLALVGEQGPELVNIPRGSQILNAAETRQSSMGNNVFNFYSPKALDAGEQSRFMRSSMRQLAAEGVI